MRKFSSLILLIAFLACQSVAAAQSPVKIGWIGPLTGNASVLGVDTVPAMQLVFDSVNAAGGIEGRPINLISEDDQYTTQKAVAAYNRLVHHEKIRVLVVLTYGGLFALAPLAEKDGVLLLDPLDCDERIAKLPTNTLCITKRTEDLGRVNAEHVLSKNEFPAGVIYYDGDPFMSVAAEASARTLSEHGHKWTSVGTYNESTTDFRTLVLKAKQAQVKSLFLYGYDQMGTAMKEARGLGLKANFYTLATSTSPGFQDLAGTALEGTFFPNWQAPRNEKFETFLGKFRAKVGREPYMEISTIPSYDIAQLIVNGLQRGALKADGQVDMPRLRSYFYSLKNYQGLSGAITVDPDGITRSFPVFLKVWNGGKAQVVQ
jgi:branched-chain amino acid transport system substrate-binding protein